MNLVFMFRVLKILFMVGVKNSGQNKCSFVFIYISGPCCVCFEF